MTSPTDLRFCNGARDYACQVIIVRSCGWITDACEVETRGLRYVGRTRVKRCVSPLPLHDQFGHAGHTDTFGHTRCYPRRFDRPDNTWRVIKSEAKRVLARGSLSRFDSNHNADTFLLNAFITCLLWYSLKRMHNDSLRLPFFVFAKFCRCS